MGQDQVSGGVSVNDGKNIYKNVNILKFNSFLTKVSENCYYKLNFYAPLQCLGVSILTILSVIHSWNPPVSGMYCFRIMFFET